MKKSLFFCVCILILVFASGCQKKEAVPLNELKINFSIYNLLPNSLSQNHTDNNIKDINYSYKGLYSEGYFRLNRSFQYIEQLLNTLNNTIDDEIDEHQSVQGNIVNYHNNRKIKITKTNNQVNLALNNDEYNQKIRINRTYENNHMYISGSNQVNDSLFTFQLINNEELKMNYHMDPNSSESYAHLKRENDVLKTHIIYNNGKYDYNLVAVANHDLTAIYYDYNSKVEINKVFVVYDKHGDELYHSFSLHNGKNQATGWNMNAILSIQNYEYHAYDSNFYTVKVTYLNSRLDRVDRDTIIFGNLSFSEDFTNINDGRDAIKIKNYEQVMKIANELKSYYKTVINK